MKHISRILWGAVLALAGLCPSVASAQDPVSLPFTEDFETWNTDNSLPGWTFLNKAGNAKTWNVKNASSRAGTGVVFNYNHSKGDRLITPQVHITALAEFRIWAKESTAFDVLISETDTKPESFTMLAAGITSGSTWKEQKIILGENYIGKNVYIAIDYQGSFTSLYLDDLAITPNPAPAIAFAPTTNSVTLTLSPSASSYTVRYRVAGTETWTTLTDQTATVTIPGLSSATTYEVQAQAHYAGADSEWSDVMTFGTCAELPYVQDFSAVEVGQIPADWNQDDKSNFEWQGAESEGIHYLKFPVQIGSGSVYSGYSNLLTPIFTLEGIDKNHLELVFTYSQKASGSCLNVSVSADGGVTWTAVTGAGKPLGTLLYASSAANVKVDTKTLALKDLVGNAETLMIRFEGSYRSGSEIDLYDVRIQENWYCLPPLNLHVDEATQTPTTADLAWEKQEDATLTGYKLAYALTEAELETATPENLSADALTKTLTDLQANHTLYHVSLTSVCADNSQGDNESEPVAISFHTLYTCPKITDLQLKNLADVSAELAFTYATGGVSYEAEYKAVAAEAWTPYTQTVTPAGFEIGGLTAGTRYMARVRVVCGNDDQSFWDTLAFRTTGTLQDLPFNSDFSINVPWVLINEEGKNVWVIGEDANTKNEGGRCLFISPDGTKFANGLAPGTGGVQIQQKSSIAHAYFKVNLPADKTMILTFRYFVNGNSGSLSNGYVKAGLYVGVFSEIWPEGTAPGTASEYIKSYYPSPFYSTGEWQEAVIAIDGSKHSGDQYIVFTWRNDDSSPSNRFAAVDNVELRVDDCPAPSALTVGEVAAHSITYSWTAGEGISGLNDYTYQIQKREGAGHWEDVTPAPAADATSFTLPDLKDHADYRFRIRGYRSESSYSPWVTSAVASTPYACAAPTDLAMRMDEARDYVFTWNGTHAQYELEYKASTAETWTVVSDLTEPTYTMDKSLLASATMYNVRVRGVCEAGDTPHYADQVVAFATLPYTENFDTWNADKTLNGWSIVDGNNDKYVWQEETSTKFGSSGSCAKYQGAMSSNGNDYLISPAIRIDQAAQLSFQMKTTGTINKYSVLISEKTNAVADFEKELQAETTVSVAQDWTLMSWDLTDYIGKNIYIAIKATTAQSYSFPNLYIDDFAIQTCPTPTLSLTATTDNAATFSLSPDDASCTVEYREADAEVWTALAENKTGSFSLADLTAGKLYEVRAMANCSGDMHSDYSGVVTFMLPVVKPFPLNETFSAVAAGTVPEGWSQMDAAGSHRWVVGCNETESYLAYNGRDNSEGHAYITTPVIDLTAVEADVRANLELKLVFQDPKINQYQNWFAVSLSADRGLSWQPVAEIVPEGRQRETRFVPLAAYVGEATSVMVRLEATNNSSFPAADSLRVYEVHVQPESACFPPTGITVPGRTLKASEAVVLWTAPQKCHPTGYELAYRIKDDENETILTAGVSASEFKLEALTENTLYEVAMASVCGENKSELSDPVAFTTPYACPKVRSLRAVAEKEAVRLTYPSDGATFEVEYRTSAETEWHSFSKTLTEKTCRITGLTAGTVYWARVRVLCDAETSSLWDSVRFATLCEAEPLPFAETFNGEFIDNAPLCWRYTHLAGSAEDIQWQLAKTVAHGDSAALRYAADRVGSGHSALMVSPQLEMTGDRQVLSFWMNRSEYGTRTTEEGLYVYLNSRPDTVGATRVAFLRNYLYDLTHEAVQTDSTWSLYQFELPSSQGAMYVVLQGVSAGLGSFYVDEIKVEAEYNPALINLALFDTICDGETYRFGERELTEAGRYFDTIRAAEADTARELTLTVLLKPVPPVISRQDEGKTVTLVAETPEAQVQWYEADEMIFGAEEKRFTVTYDGVYHATAIGVCGESEASNKLEVKMPTANEGLEDAAALTLYPNPSADGRFMLAVSPAYEGATLYVYSMDGRLRQRQTLHAGEQEIRLKAAETGVYMFRFVTADGRTYGLKATVR